jgi:hypothetical protein
MAAWVRRNCRRLVSVCRTGAGGIRWRLRIRRIVVAPIRWPTLGDSPCTLWYPTWGSPAPSVPPVQRGRRLSVAVRVGWVGRPPPYELAVSAQDGARGGQAVAAQSRRKFPDEDGEDGPVGDVCVRSGSGPVRDLDWIFVGLAAVVIAMTPLGWLTYVARPRRSRIGTGRPSASAEPTLRCDLGRPLPFAE